MSKPRGLSATAALVRPRRPASGGQCRGTHAPRPFPPRRNGGSRRAVSGPSARTGQPCRTRPGTTARSPCAATRDHNCSLPPSTFATGSPPRRSPPAPASNKRCLRGRPRRVLTAQAVALCRDVARRRRSCHAWSPPGPASAAPSGPNTNVSCLCWPQHRARRLRYSIARPRPWRRCRRRCARSQPRRRRRPCEASRCPARVWRVSSAMRIAVPYLRAPLGGNSPRRACIVDP
mmetsp:Transcript_24762/g.69061  ORF Transcript_24762/g.69061 Transcript_24762/m.69061 type:complete len:233 (+) Transcript_24762:1104-1802(+)